MPRTHQVKARWGLPLDHYLPIFTSTHSRPDNAVFSIEDGYKAITKLCSLAGESEQRKQNAIANSIVLLELQAILNLAASPEPHFHAFLRPSLISACITLLKISTQSGLPSLLSHEYGLLTFQILKITLGLCIIDRTYGLEVMTGTMTLGMVSASERFRELSVHTSRSLDIHIKDHTCDQMLGWTETAVHPPATPLVSPPEVAVVLNLLYEDRQHFLKVFMLLPPLTRHILRSSGDVAAGSLYEILWRYFLIVPTDQLPVHIAAYHDVNGMLNSRSRNTDDHNLEDSRLLLRAFIQRFSPSDRPLMDIKTFINIQILVLPFMKPGCEDLAPFIFETSVHQLWIFLRESCWNGGKDGFISDVIIIFEHLRY
ncbi:hypothetical protein RSAG8_11762, partial [Rhizoctonia solani AG-8 WAC10335]